MYKKLIALLAIPGLITVHAFGQAKTISAAAAVAVNNVVWYSPGSNENDSMPLGNGDIAANVWTEKNGDLIVLLAKADAWAETGNIIKLGRVRIKLSPSPFADSIGFSQTLRLDNGSIEISRGNDKLTLWVDANNPVMHAQAS